MTFLIGDFNRSNYSYIAGNSKDYCLASFINFLVGDTAETSVQVVKVDTLFFLLFCF